MCGPNAKQNKTLQVKERKEAKSLFLLSKSFRSETLHGSYWDLRIPQDIPKRLQVKIILMEATAQD